MYLELRWSYINGAIKEDSFHCAICTIYDPHVREEKAQLWPELKKLRETVDVPTMFIGDFNEILKSEERKGGVNLTSSCMEFRQWVADMELIDLPLISRKFTWFKSRSCSRLDMALMENE